MSNNLQFIPIGKKYENLEVLFVGSECCESEHAYGPHIRDYTIIHYVKSGEGVLYDKNHVPVLDYDLNVKHEEERPKISPDATSDERFKDVYQDRMTDRTVAEDLTEDFYVDFDDVNVYGVKLKEGKEAEYTCCICGDDFDGFGNNPAPYKESGKCCDACNKKHSNQQNGEAD